jgi:hypothetical protein
VALNSTGWVVGWLNMLGQVAGVASTEFGLAQMICKPNGMLTATSITYLLESIGAGCVVGFDGDFQVTVGMQFGLFVGLLIVHGLLK